MKDNKQKPEVKVMFSGQYPEESKRDVIDLLEENFVVETSDGFMFRKYITIWISVSLGFLTIYALRLFLKAFSEESGKLLAQRLFKAADKAKEKSSEKVDVQIKIEYPDKEKYIEGEDESELYQNLLKSIEEIKKDIQKLSKS